MITDTHDNNICSQKLNRKRTIFNSCTFSKTLAFNIVHLKHFRRQPRMFGDWKFDHSTVILSMSKLHENGKDSSFIRIWKRLSVDAPSHVVPSLLVFSPERPLSTDYIYTFHVLQLLVTVWLLERWMTDRRTHRHMDTQTGPILYPRPLTPEGMSFFRSPRPGSCRK